LRQMWTVCQYCWGEDVAASGDKFFRFSLCEVSVQHGRRAMRNSRNVGKFLLPDVTAPSSRRLP